jgi:tryptophan-rich sensory protein
MTKDEKVKLPWYFLLVIFNFAWSHFFGLRAPVLGLIVIAMMWVCIVLTMKKFYPLSRLAFYILIPYLLWVSFASLLNAGIVFLN